MTETQTFTLKLSPRATMVCDAALRLAIEIDTEQGSTDNVRVYRQLSCIRSYANGLSLARRDAGTLVQALQTYMQHLQESSFLRKEAEQLSVVLDDFVLSPSKASAPKDVSFPAGIDAEDPTEAKLRIRRDSNLREFMRFLYSQGVTFERTSGGAK